MRHPKHIVELFCDICDTKVGEAKTLEPMTTQAYRLQVGIVDQRCDACNATHGTFNELAEEYEKKTGHPGKTAEVFVQLFRKRADFSPALVAIVDKIKEGKGGIIKNN